MLLVGCDARQRATVDPAAEPVAAAGRTSCGEAHQLTETAEGLVLEPDPGLGLARVTWEGDLNNDGREDLIVRFGDACSGYGECPLAVLAACEAAGFEMAWEPEYAVEIEPLRRHPLAKGPAALCETNQWEPDASGREAVETDPSGREAVETDASAREAVEVDPGGRDAVAVDPSWMPLIETRRDGERTVRRVLCFAGGSYASAGSVESG